MEEESDHLQQRQSVSSYMESSSSHVEEEEEEEEEGHTQGPYGNSDQRSIGLSHTINTAADDLESTFIRDEAWTSIAVVLTFWFFVSMTLVLGVYGSINVTLGPGSSLLLQANPIFVQYVTVEELDESKPGLVLYGFHKTPPLNVVANWSKTYNATVPAYSHQEWVYHLNKGAQINISYHVNSLSSTSMYLVIAQGSEGIAQWLEDPTYPNTTLSWNVIHGKGLIQQEIFTSSVYYVALGNVNSNEVEVQLDFEVRNLMYNTTDAYYSCSLNHDACSLKMHIPKADAAVLSSSVPAQGRLNDEWYVNISYGPRWITYIVGTGGMTLLMLLAFNFLNKFQFARANRTAARFGEIASSRSPLLSQKDDDILSWGSSYDSLSHDEDEPEELLADSSLERMPCDGENQTITRRLCAICFDAPRDCFFLPCGHCVACFMCATRILEAGGTCPVCRRNMRKVRRIFTV